MNFMTTLFFVILTSGIHNAYAEWEDDRELLQKYFYIFLDTLESIAKQVNYFNQPQVQKIREKGILKDYKENFVVSGGNYENFLAFTSEKFNYYIPDVVTPLALLTYSYSILIRGAVKKFANQINKDNQLPNTYKNENLPLRDYLQSVYIEHMKVTIEKFRDDVDPKPDSSTASLPDPATPSVPDPSTPSLTNPSDSFPDRSTTTMSGPLISSSSITSQL